MGGRKGFENTSDPTAFRSLYVDSLRIFIVRDVTHRELDGFIDGERVAGFPVLGPYLIEAYVGGDPGDPRTQLVAAVEVSQRRVHAQERLLGCFLGILLV